ncbi:unnamed protein product, partial [Protopolystoma xenopodis]
LELGPLTPGLYDNLVPSKPTVIRARVAATRSGHPSPRIPVPDLARLPFLPGLSRGIHSGSTLPQTSSQLNFGEPVLFSSALATSVVPISLEQNSKPVCSLGLLSANRGLRNALDCINSSPSPSLSSSSSSYSTSLHTYPTAFVSSSSSTSMLPITSGTITSCHTSLLHSSPSTNGNTMMSSENSDFESIGHSDVNVLGTLSRTNATRLNQSGMTHRLPTSSRSRQNAFVRPVR